MQFEGCEVPKQAAPSTMLGSVPHCQPCRSYCSPVVPEGLVDLRARGEILTLVMVIPWCPLWERRQEGSGTRGLHPVPVPGRPQSSVASSCHAKVHETSQFLI